MNTINDMDDIANKAEELGDILRKHFKQEFEEAGIPSVMCLCGETYYGYALKSMKCYCDKCGRLLNAPDYEIDGEETPE